MAEYSKYDIILKSKLGFTFNYPCGGKKKNTKCWESASSLSVECKDGRCIVRSELMEYQRFIMVFSAFYKTAKENVECDKLTRLSIDVCSEYGDASTRNINATKLLLSFDEDYMFGLFPNREGCYGAHRVSRMLPSTVDGFVGDVYEQYANYITLSDDMYGISFGRLAEGCVTFGYMGGKDVLDDYTRLTEGVSHYVVSVGEALLNPSYTTGDMAELGARGRYYSSMKEVFASYANFKKHYKKANFYIDLAPFDNMESVYWPVLRPRLYCVMALCVGEKAEANLNYDSDEGALQLRGLKIKHSISCEDVTFVDCEVNGLFRRCTFYNSDVSWSGLCDCYMLGDTNMSHCTMENCYVGEWTERKRCEMVGGMNEIEKQNDNNPFVTY